MSVEITLTYLLVEWSKQKCVLNLYEIRVRSNGVNIFYFTCDKLCANRQVRFMF